MGLGILPVNQLEELVVDVIDPAHIHDIVVREDLGVDALALGVHSEFGEASAGDGEQDGVVDVFHRRLEVFKHEAVKISGAFAHCGVLDVGGCEIGCLLEGDGMQEDDQTVGGFSGKIICPERNSVHGNMSEQAGDIESERLPEQLRPVELDKGNLLTNVLLKLLRRDIEHILQVPGKKTVHCTLQHGQVSHIKNKLNSISTDFY